MKNQPEISISIVTHNSAKKIQACLNSVLRQQELAAQSWEIFISDNASADETLKKIKRLKKGNRAIQVLSYPKNLGFGGAHNRVLKKARGRFFLILNDDVVLQPRYLSQLLERLKSDTRLAAVTGKLRDRKSGVVDTGIYLLTPWRKMLRISGRSAEIAQRPGLQGLLGLSTGVTGCAALFRTSCLRQEPFDASYFMYGEDVDVCWRLQKRGYRFAEVSGAIAVHSRSYRFLKRFDVEEYLRARVLINRYFSVAKNENIANLLFWAPAYFAYETAQLSYLILRDPGLLKIYPEMIKRIPAYLKVRSTKAKR